MDSSSQRLLHPLPSLLHLEREPGASSAHLPCHTPEDGARAPVPASGRLPRLPQAQFRALRQVPSASWSSQLEEPLGLTGLLTPCEGRGGEEGEWREVRPWKRCWPNSKDGLGRDNPCLNLFNLINHFIITFNSWRLI